MERQGIRRSIQSFIMNLVGTNSHPEESGSQGEAANNNANAGVATNNTSSTHNQVTTEAVGTQHRAREDSDSDSVPSLQSVSNSSDDDDSYVDSDSEVQDQILPGQRRRPRGSNDLDQERDRRHPSHRVSSAHNTNLPQQTALRSDVTNSRPVSPGQSATSSGSHTPSGVNDPNLFTRLGLGTSTGSQSQPSTLGPPPAHPTVPPPPPPPRHNGVTFETGGMAMQFSIDRNGQLNVVNAHQLPPQHHDHMPEFHHQHHHQPNTMPQHGRGLNPNFAAQYPNLANMFSSMFNRGPAGAPQAANPQGDVPMPAAGDGAPTNAAPRNPNTNSDQFAGAQAFLSSLLRTEIPLFHLDLGALGDLGRDVEDVDRARMMIDNLAVVHPGLVRRLERVAKILGGEGTSDGIGPGDGGCAICWEKLLPDVDQAPDVLSSVPQTNNDVAPSVNSDSSDVVAPTAESSTSPTPAENKIIALPCSHIFHSECLVPWFSKRMQTSCPTCRFQLDPERLTEGYGTRERRRREREERQQATTPGAAVNADPERHGAATHGAGLESAPPLVQLNQPLGTQDAPNQQHEAPRIQAGSQARGVFPTLIILDVLDGGPIPPLSPPATRGDAGLPAILPQNDMAVDSEPVPGAQTEGSNHADSTRTDPQQAATPSQVQQPTSQTPLPAATGGMPSLPTSGSHTQPDELVMDMEVDLNMLIEDPTGDGQAPPTLGPLSGTGLSLPPFYQLFGNVAPFPPARAPIAGQTSASQTSSAGSRSRSAPIDTLPFPFPSFAASTSNNATANPIAGPSSSRSPGAPASGFAPLRASPTGANPISNDSPIHTIIQLAQEFAQSYARSLNGDVAPGSPPDATNAAPSGPSNSVPGGSSQQFTSGPTPASPPAGAAAAPEQAQQTRGPFTAMGPDGMGGFVLSGMISLAGPGGVRQAIPLPPRHYPSLPRHQNSGIPTPSQNAPQQPQPQSSPNPPLPHLANPQRGIPPFAPLLRDAAIATPPPTTLPSMAQRSIPPVDVGAPASDNATSQPPASQNDGSAAAVPIPTAGGAPTPTGNGIPTPPLFGRNNILDLFMSGPNAFSGPNVRPRTTAFRDFPEFEGFFPAHPPAPPRPRKQWTVPAGSGPSLRERVEKMEREARLRCSDISCGIGPSDEEPDACLGEDGAVKICRQIPIHGSGLEKKLACAHTFHPSCLVSAERAQWKGDEEEHIDEGSNVDVSCPVCRSSGFVLATDWRDGVAAL